MAEVILAEELLCADCPLRKIGDPEIRARCVLALNRALRNFADGDDLHGWYGVINDAVQDGRLYSEEAQVTDCIESVVDYPYSCVNYWQKINE